MAQLACALPGAHADLDTPRRWLVRDKLFAWERPLRTTDHAALGDAAPTGPVLAVRVPDTGVREALIADRPDVYFTIPHFARYPAVLIRLAVIDETELAEALGEAWACRAPARLVAEHEDGASRRPDG